MIGFLQIMPSGVPYIIDRAMYPDLFYVRLSKEVVADWPKGLVGMTYDTNKTYKENRATVWWNGKAYKEIK